MTWSRSSARSMSRLPFEVTGRFPADERFGLTSQLRRASIGVVSDIAEGQGRLTYGEWRQFLSQARGSLYEVEAQLIAANRLTFLDSDDLRRLTVLIRRAGRALAGLITWVRGKETKQPSNGATQKPFTARRSPTAPDPPPPPPRS